MFNFTFQATGISNSLPVPKPLIFSKHIVLYWRLRGMLLLLIKGYRVCVYNVSIRLARRALEFKVALLSITRRPSTSKCLGSLTPVDWITLFPFSFLTRFGKWNTVVSTFRDCCKAFQIKLRIWMLDRITWMRNQMYRCLNISNNLNVSVTLKARNSINVYSQYIHL